MGSNTGSTLIICCMAPRTPASSPPSYTFGPSGQRGQLSFLQGSSPSLSYILCRGCRAELLGFEPQFGPNLSRPQFLHLPNGNKNITHLKERVTPYQSRTEVLEEKKCGTEMELRNVRQRKGSGMVPCMGCIRSGPNSS